MTDVLCTADIVLCSLKQSQNAALNVLPNVFSVSFKRDLALTSCLSVRGRIARDKRDVQGPCQCLRHEGLAGASGATVASITHSTTHLHHQDIALLNDDVGIFLRGRALNGTLDGRGILGLRFLFQSSLFSSSSFLLPSLLQPCFLL